MNQKEEHLGKSQNMMANWLLRNPPRTGIILKKETSDVQMPSNIATDDNFHKKIDKITEMETMFSFCSDPEPETLLSENLFGYETAGEIDCNNPSTWPEIDENFRNFMIVNGIDNGKNCDLTQSIDGYGRKFTRNWFTKKFKNGESADRKWLMYSKRTKKIYCFPCMLFRNPADRKQKFGDPKVGFNNWKYLNPRIANHENSVGHQNKFSLWMQFEQQNDANMMEVFEKENWRSILKVVLDVILLCAKNNLALRERNDDISSDTGNFLALIKLISFYHPNLEEYLYNHELGAVNYLSNQIVDQLINVLGNKVRNKISEAIKVAKYYEIQLHEASLYAEDEQMSLVLRYVEMIDGKVLVRQSFVDFIETFEKTEELVANEILAKLSANGIDIRNIRGQSYGKENKILQARILQENSLARFVPSLSQLVVLNAAKSSPIMVKFFEIVQDIFVYFSSSIRRWEILKSALKISLQSRTDTRWAMEVKAVKALNTQITDVCNGLQVIWQSSVDLERRCTIDNLLKRIDLKFLICLSYWDLLLSGVEINDHNKVEIVNIATQNAKILNICDYFPEKELFFILMEDFCKILYGNLKSTYEEIAEINRDFAFLTTNAIVESASSDIEKAANELSLKYNCDLNAIQLCVEISNFKHHVAEYFYEYGPVPQELLQYIYDFELTESFPNIEIALRIFLTMSLAPTTYCDKSFEKSKLIQNFLKSKLSQENCPNLSILSIESDLAEKINFDEVIEEFVDLK